MIARPRIKAVDKKQLVSAQSMSNDWALTMNIALTLVRLHHKQVGYMTPDVVLIAGGIAAKHFLQTVAS